jgi:hypothetical protein
MTKVKRVLLVIALGALTLMGLSAHAQANAKDNDLSGDWKGTCTKVSTGSTWHLDLTIRDDGTYSWTSRFPAAEGSPARTVHATGRVDRTSRQLLDDKPEYGKIDGYYSVDGNRMQLDTGNGMARCSLTR